MSDCSCPLTGNPPPFVGGVHYVCVHALIIREVCVRRKDTHVSVATPPREIWGCISTEISCFGWLYLSK